MSDYSTMDCAQLAAALAAETDPIKRAEIEAVMQAKGCNPQTNDDPGSGPKQP